MSKINLCDHGGYPFCMYCMSPDVHIWHNDQFFWESTVEEKESVSVPDKESSRVNDRRRKKSFYDYQNKLYSKEERRLKIEAYKLKKLKFRERNNSRIKRYVRRSFFAQERPREKGRFKAIVPFVQDAPPFFSASKNNIENKQKFEKKTKKKLKTKPKKN